MSIDESELKRLKELCEKATPGPWFAGEARNPNWLYAEGGQYSSEGWQIGDMQGARCDEAQDVANARFIAAAREWLPRLLLECEQQREHMERLRRTGERVVAERDEARAELERLKEALAPYNYHHPMCPKNQDHACTCGLSEVRKSIWGSDNRPAPEPTLARSSNSRRPSAHERADRLREERDSLRADNAALRAEVERMKEGR